MRAWLSLIVLTQFIVSGFAYAETDAVPEPGKTPTLSASPDPTLGPWAIDEKGNVGRIHTVVSGDTLWDISASYLGTAWVWPAVWHDNDEIANPHRIAPEDRIWITAGEIKKITRERADAMIAARVEQTPPVQQEMVEAVEDVVAEPVAPRRRVRVAERGAMGFVSRSAVEAATSVVGSPSPREWLAGGEVDSLGRRGKYRIHSRGPKSSCGWGLRLHQPRLFGRVGPGIGNGSLQPGFPPSRKGRFQAGDDPRSHRCEPGHRRSQAPYRSRLRGRLPEGTRGG